MEEVIVALQSILSHKMRSILTMLGIIIGIAAIIAIFSIIEGSTENTKRQLIGGRNNTIDVIYNKKSALDPTIPAKKNAKKPLFIPFMGEDVLEKLKKIEGVKNASISYEADHTVYYLKKEVSSKVSATTVSTEQLKQLKILKGEGMTSKAFQNQEQVITLEQSLYNQLFPNDDGLGKYVEINGAPFKVIGVFSSEATSASGSFGSNKIAYIPLQQRHKLSDEINVDPLVTVQTQRADDLKGTAQRAGTYLNSLLAKSDYAFGIMNLNEFERQLDNINKSNFILLAGIASISLIVGGIGVMNIMLVSVTERTREIGIKKALGARRKVILKQFLIEAIILTLIGGIIGVIAGIISGFVITHSLAYPYILSILSVVISLAFCCIIGIVFGLLPAIKASKLDPIEALRFE